MRTQDETLAAAKADMAQAGIGIPNDEWPFDYGNYCCSSVVGWMDDTGGHARYAIENISIAALRADRKWPEGTKPRVGALVLMNFDGGAEPEHIGLCRGVDGDSTLTYEGNTGPEPGVPNPNGFYERSRPSEYVVGYVYPPYPKTAAAEEAPMQIQSRQLKKHQGLTSGAWRTIELDHPGQFSFETDPGSYMARVSLAFDHLDATSVVQARLIVVTVNALGKATGTPRALSLTEIHGSAGQAFGQLVDYFTLAKGERARLQVLGDSSVSLAAGSVAWAS